MGVPCPYDIIERSDALRSWVWTSVSGVTRADHESGGKVHYMRITARGNSWGFECTYSGCPFEIANGDPYFHA